MSEIRLLERGEEETWTRFTESRPEALLGHRIEWRDVFEKELGHSARYLVAEEGGAVRGVLPLMCVSGLVGGRALVSLPWLDAAGPLARDSDTAADLLARATTIAREEGCAYLEVRSLEEHPGTRPVRTHKVLLVLPLDEPRRMWEGFSAKVRNQVRKAEREGVTGEAGGEEKLPDFYRVFSRNMRDIGVPVWGESFFRGILRSMGAGARLLVVRFRGSPIGGALLLLHGGAAIVPSASSLRSHFALCPNHMLYWTAIQEAWASGARLFDFGRSTLGSGTHHFKSQWGASEKPCYWHYALLRTAGIPEKSTESPRLRWAVEVWKRLPVPLANRLGPFLARRIP
jgi:FemAB-related protein (PEP-CTERM system-associated)